ncbi:hypothetical protein MKX41_30775 [Paenibacillus sp. FSL R5-0475]|uniref:hypothetical protein n=1 Tax=Paenibacillus sp. FSL R5-0475 TaxID=2921643 RepID=UPI0030FC71DD
MQTGKTNRGFAIIEFEDLYGDKCSIQKSSLATEDAIWIGVSDANPQIMASQTPQGGTGWVPYAIPEGVLLSTRMHINQDQAKEIIEVLQRFVDTGDI